jgi:hypothetical protein
VVVPRPTPKADGKAPDQHTQREIAATRIRVPRRDAESGCGQGFDAGGAGMRRNIIATVIEPVVLSKADGPKNASARIASV